MARSALLNVMCQAALKAGRGLARDFGEVQNLQVSIKGPGDFVTSADTKAEQVIRYQLEKARPDWGFLMEESGEIPGSDPQHRWIVDPLDGTTNFLHGIPLFCVSIGLERDGRMVAGVVYNPVLDELFTAELGVGAHLNDRRIRVGARRDLGECVIGTGVPHMGKRGHGQFASELTMIAERTAGVRRLGAAALDLAYVAAGRYDGFWERGLKPWDIAAGMIIVGEAGGLVSSTDGIGSPIASGGVIAGNEAIHKKLVGLLSSRTT